MEIKNLGIVRGGCNSMARFHLHVLPMEELTESEYQAIFEAWDEEFGLRGIKWAGWVYSINTRREFALLPAIIRKALKAGYDVACSAWDVWEEPGIIRLSEKPAEFWQALAMAQAFYGPKEVKYEQV